MHPTEVLVVIDRAVVSLMMLQQSTLNSTAIDRLQCIDTVTRMLLGLPVKGVVHMDRAVYTSYAALSANNPQNLIQRVPEQYTNRVIGWLHNTLSALGQEISYEDISQLGDGDDNEDDDSFELFEFESSLYRHVLTIGDEPRGNNGMANKYVKNAREGAKDARRQRQDKAETWYETPPPPHPQTSTRFLYRG